ncbi:complement C1q tumor necrosis factor-related protein 1-like isoform X2 [Oncorhynchus keta]|nr:complement C1q tumor necrosis factor-related protein 1-like isoform X2 [Oncorhynchus keta]XP_052333706.1 complement C1q tumor necrosis factor-related protein 1-like isoform X2 [Oncorhynchus keta]
MKVGGGPPPPSLCAWVVLLILVESGEPYRTPYDQEQGQNRDRDRESTDSRTDTRDYHRDARPDTRTDTRDYHRDARPDTWDYHRDASEVRGKECQRCCDPGEEVRTQSANPQYPQHYPQYQAVPQINITILKGEKGGSGQRGPYGKSGKSGQSGPRGPNGIKGTKGSIGTPGDPCKVQYAAFSVGRKKAIHSNDYYQTLVFDTELVNLYGHFNMFTGKFYCYVPGIYYFSLNVHTWNQKETYVHVMHNEREVVILYAQSSDRSIMQSQSLMLELEREDQVWVRLFKGERENAIFSDDFDTYITFNGHLIKPKSEG